MSIAMQQETNDKLMNELDSRKADEEPAENYCSHCFLIKHYQTNIPKTKKQSIYRYFGIAFHMKSTCSENASIN